MSRIFAPPTDATNVDDGGSAASLEHPDLVGRGPEHLAALSEKSVAFEHVNRRKEPWRRNRLHHEVLVDKGGSVGNLGALAPIVAQFARKIRRSSQREDHTRPCMERGRHLIGFLIRRVV